MRPAKGDEKVKLIVCDKCQGEFDMSNVGATMQLGNLIELPGYGDVDTIHFKCPHCGEIYMIMSEDSVITSIRRDIQSEFKNVRSVAEKIKTAIDREELEALSRDYDAGMKRIDTLQTMMKKKVDVLNHKVKIYLKNKEREEKKDETC